MSTFINPYNFIPVESKEIEKKEKEKSGTYSGVIRYKLMTRTPLIIPNTSNEDFFRMKVEGHRSYDFFSYNNLENKTVSDDKFYEPVIPGSEIRGMIRSNYEILTNSCMPVIDETKVLSKRTVERFKAGLLKKNDDGSYSLYAAEDCLLRTVDDPNSLEDEWEDNAKYWKYRGFDKNVVKEGQKVSFEYNRRPKGKPLAKNVKPVSQSTFRLNNRVFGYIIKGMEGPDMSGAKTQKHCAHIFKQKNNLIKKLSKAELFPLEEVLKEYNDNNEGAYKEYKNNYNKFKKGETDKNGHLLFDMFPVYYSTIENSDYYMLSPACITREIYKTKIKDILNQHEPCISSEKLCPACRLFGLIGKEGRETFQVASRIRFSDLYRCPGGGAQDTLRDLYLNCTTLDPLGSPQLSNTEFYLERPEKSIFWTYDYYIDKQGKEHVQTAYINGRKFYWHGELNLEKFKKTKPDQLNVSVRPLKREIEFEGSVYYENLTKEELDMLVYTINAGENSNALKDKKHGYKLGHAKPLGFGSVAMNTVEVVQKKYILDDSDCTVKMVETPYSADVPEKVYSKNNFEKMTSFDAVKGKISYPIPKETVVVGQKETYPVFKWFAENHKCYKEEMIKTNAPVSRRDTLMVKYLEPMQPELADTLNSKGGSNIPKTPVKKAGNQTAEAKSNASSEPAKDGRIRGTIGRVFIKQDNKYAFIKYDKEEVYLNISNMENPDEFYRLKTGKTVVSYILKKKADGKKYADSVRIES